MVARVFVAAVLLPPSCSCWLLSLRVRLGRWGRRPGSSMRRARGGRRGSGLDGAEGMAGEGRGCRLMKMGDDRAPEKEEEEEKEGQVLQQ